MRAVPAKVEALFGTKSIVVVESPFGAPCDWTVELNKAYARACLRWCLLNGLVPLASHLLYTQMLDDRDANERMIGIEAGLTVNAHAVATLAFCDRGVSRGMVLGIRRSMQEQRPVYSLRLPGWLADAKSRDFRRLPAEQTGTIASL